MSPGILVTVVIKNERTYRITKAQAEKFRLALTQLDSQGRLKRLDPRLWRAQRDGMSSQLDDLEKELRDFQALKAGKQERFDLASFDDLPRVLIQVRIAAGLTQDEFAARLGVVPQQVQRDEASEYQGASFRRICEVMRALSLTVRGKVRLVRVPHGTQEEGNERR